jgi:hypothetical protein
MSKTENTPKKSILTTAMENVEKAKPSNLDDQKKETVVRRMKYTIAFASGVLLMAATTATANYYANIAKTEDGFNETTLED